jgi:hypothetical protein
LVGAGPARRRYGPHSPGLAREPHFTLCNLAVRADAMVPFPLGLHTGEECAILNQLRRNNHRMWYDPRLAVFHERRPTLRTFTRQVFGYGRGRARIVRRGLDKVRVSFLLPLLLLLYLALVLPLLALLSLVALAPLALYGTIVLAQAVKIGFSIPSIWWAAPAAALLIVIVHIWYAIGSIAGVLGRSRVLDAGPARWADLSTR